MGLVDQAAEIDEFRTVSDNLAHRLGGDDLAPVELAAEKKLIDQRAGDTGHQDECDAGHAVEATLKQAFGIWPVVLRR